MSAIRLSLSEEVGLSRVAEVVRAGLPVPAGTMRHAADHLVTDRDDGVLPSQALWAERDQEGWIRWLGLAFALDLEALATVDVTVHVGGASVSDRPRPNPESAGPVDAMPPARAAVITTPGGIDMVTGTTQLSMSLAPFELSSPDLSMSGGRVVLVGANGERHPAWVDPDGVAVVHEGPLLAQVTLAGRHVTGDGRPLWAFRARLTAAAGASSVDLEITVINDDGGNPDDPVAGWAVEFATGPIAGGACGVFSTEHHSSAPFEIRHRGLGHRRGMFATSEVSGGRAWCEASDPEGSNRWGWSELTGRRASNWLSARTLDGGGLTVAAKQFAENHPADLALLTAGVSVRIWPEEAGPLPMHQGAAKTRMIRVSRGHAPQLGLLLDSPLVARVDNANSVGGAPRYLAYLPEKYPNLEAHIREEMSSWYQSGQSLGFFDFGDSMQGIVSGPRTGYSANNEHDALLALTLHYLRSGERSYYDSAQAYADHICDIDQIHHSTVFAAEVGGLRAHGPGHVHYVDARTAHGPVRTSLDTGHLWTEGLVLFGRISGERRYVEAAQLVADCIMGLADIGWTRPEPGPRNAGWPLIALCSVAEATGENRYLDAAGHVARAAIAAQRPDGRWLMRIGMVDDYCAWQNAVLLIGLARLLELDESADVRAAFGRGCRSLLDLGRNRDGTFVYLNRFDYRWANRSALIREALGLAFSATADERFLAAGLAGGSRWYRPRTSAAALSNDVAEWRGHLPFLACAHQAGLLRDLADAE